MDNKDYLYEKGTLGESSVFGKPDYALKTTMKEQVLEGTAVMYGGTERLREAMEYDLQMEQVFSYANLSMCEIELRMRSCYGNAGYYRTTGNSPAW